MYDSQQNITAYFNAKQQLFKINEWSQWLYAGCFQVTVFLIDNLEFNLCCCWNVYPIR